MIMSECKVLQIRPVFQVVQYSLYVFLALKASKFSFDRLEIIFVFFSFLLILWADIYNPMQDLKFDQDLALEIKRNSRRHLILAVQECIVAIQICF